MEESTAKYLPAFGERVRVTAKLKRFGAAGAGRKVAKRWHRWPVSGREGIYIGKRTLSNGHTVDDGEEGGYYYVPGEYFPAALVVFSERETPVLVPFDALEPAE